MKRGQDGHSLYPAMPYTAYAKVTPDDVKALYAYFMHGVEPVKQANKDTDLAAVDALAAGRLELDVRARRGHRADHHHPRQRRRQAGAAARPIPGRRAGPSQHLPHPRGFALQEKGADRR